MNPLVRKAIERHEKEASSASRENLEEQILKAFKRAYDNGVNDGLSRASVRPGFGDMGG